MILMALGPYRFSLATFTHDQLVRSFTARTDSVPVIGSRPSVHRLGYDDETVDLDATFFPFHLPGNRGLSQLAMMRSDVGSAYPLISVAGGSGFSFGTWLIRKVGSREEHIGVAGVGQEIRVDLSLLFTGVARPAGVMSLIGGAASLIGGPAAGGAISAAVSIGRTLLR